MDSKNNESISYSDEVFVTINDKNVKVAKLGLLDYAKMSGILRELIASIISVFQEQAEVMEGVGAAPEQQFIFLAELISALVEKNVLQVINFVDLCVPELGREYIETKVGLYDLVLLFDAILKVNRINQAIEEGKKLITNYMRSREA